MKKIFVLLVICGLLLSGCQQQTVDKSLSDSPTATPEASTVTPSEPVPDIDETALDEVMSETSDDSGWLLSESKTETVQDGVMSLHIPATMNSVENIPGTLAIFYGQVVRPDGDKDFCEITINHVFQKEEPVMDYNVFNSLIEIVLTSNLGHDIKFERIKDVTVNENTKGFYTHYTYTFRDKEFDRYIFFISSKGVYYTVSFIAKRDFVNADDVIALFDTYALDAEKETAWVNDFNLDIRDGYYYSASLDGAKLKLSDDLSCTESSRLYATNSILSVTLNSNYGSMFISAYPKDRYDYNSYQDFTSDMIGNIILRGLYESDDPDRDVQQYLTANGQLYFYYPQDNGVFILHYPFEYEDAFYNAEIMFTGPELNELYTLMDGAESFVAPGKNITPVFTEADDDSQN